MKKYEFDALVRKIEGMDAAFIDFPYDVQKEFGVRGRVKVKVTFDNYEYRGSLVKMGHNCHLIGMTKEVRKAIWKNPGDTVHVILIKDEEPRVVEIPKDLQKLFQNNDKARNSFEKLSYTHRKEYVQWIESAKKSETRVKRLQKTIGMLSENNSKRNPDS